MLNGVQPAEYTFRAVAVGKGKTYWQTLCHEHFGTSLRYRRS